MSALIETKQQLRFLVVEENPLTRLGIFTTAILFPCLEYCGEAPDARKARQMCAQEKPQLVIVDFMVPHGSLSLLRELTIQLPGVRLLVVSACEDPLVIRRAYRAGVLGYVTKGEEAVQIFIALESMIRGVRYSSARVTQILVDASRERTDGTMDRLSLLSDRELAVFRELGQKCGPTYIARKFGISIKTVEVHFRRIKEKLGVETAANLRRFAESCHRKKSKENFHIAAYPRH